MKAPGWQSWEPKISYLAERTGEGQPGFPTEGLNPPQARPERRGQVSGPHRGCPSPGEDDPGFRERPAAQTPTMQAHSCPWERRPVTSQVGEASATHTRDSRPWPPRQHLAPQSLLTWANSSTAIQPHWSGKRRQRFKNKTAADVVVATECTTLTPTPTASVPWKALVELWKPAQTRKPPER